MASKLPTQTFKVCETIHPGDLIALGDVHGQAEHFFRFLSWVDNTRARVVLLGDLIDRSSSLRGDLLVLDETKHRLDDPEKFGLESFHALMGNHEWMFLGAAREDFGPYRTATTEWLGNGGNHLACWEMAERHGNWLAELPFYLTIGENLFIHAGLFPGHDPQKILHDGHPEDLLWIREPFLRLGPQLEKWNPRIKKVVHGHTPTIFEEYNKQNDLGFAPVVTKDRVNIDTGACFTKNDPQGFLTAYNVTQNTFKFFKSETFTC